MSVLKKSVSCLLVLIMVVHLLPVSVLADGAARGKQAQEKTVSRPIPEVPAEPVEEQRIVLGSWDLDFVEETEDTGTTESRELTWTPRLAAPVPTVGQILEAEDGEEEPEEFEFVIEEDGTATLTAYNGSGPNVEIPPEYDVYPVKAIDGGVFNGHEEIETVVLPDMLSYIGDRAFWGCRNLKNVEFPSTLEYIGFGAFYDSGLEKVRLVSDFNCSFGGSVFEACTNLKEAELGGSITSICGSMFKGDRNLERVDLNDGLLEIGGEAFRETGLTYIELPDSVTTIESAAFYGCSALKGFHWPKDWAESGGRIFAGSGIVRYDIPDGVESIPYGAFEGAEKLVSVTIPDSVIAIGARAFEGCKNLETFNYPVALEEAGAYMIRGCESLKTIEIPEGVEAIPESTFNGADCLREVAFPSTLKSIGDTAFINCGSLQYVWTTGNLESIGSGAFCGCASLESIDLSGTIRVIPYNCFAGCVSLISVKLPDTLEEINGNAFMTCESLNKLKIPVSVKTINSSGPGYGYGSPFAGCVSLMFYCNEKCYAATYAMTNGIPLMTYKNDEEIIDNANLLFKSTYEIRKQGYNSFNCIPMLLEYDFSDGIIPQRITFVFSDNMEVYNSRMWVNGEPVTYYHQEGDFQSASGNLSFSGTQIFLDTSDLPDTSTGKITFQLKPLAYGRVKSFAYVNAAGKDGKVQEAVLGVIDEEVPFLTLNATKVSDVETVTVNGITVSGNSVQLYVNGVLQGEVQANKAGYYTGTVTIDADTGKSQIIRAETTDFDGALITASTEVSYNSDAIRILSFQLGHAQTIDVIGATNYRPDGTRMEPGEAGQYQYSRKQIVFVPGQPFEFTILVNKPDEVETIYVCSKKDGVEHVIEAHRVEGEDYFYGKGFWSKDPGEGQYVPNNIYFEYTPKSKPVSFVDLYNRDYSDVFSALSQMSEDVDINIYECTEEQQEFDLCVKETGGTISVYSYNSYLETEEEIQQLLNNGEYEGNNVYYDDYGNKIYFGYSFSDTEIKTVFILVENEQVDSQNSTRNNKQKIQGPSKGAIVTGLDMLGSALSSEFAALTYGGGLYALPGALFNAGLALWDWENINRCYEEMIDDLNNNDLNLSDEERQQLLNEMNSMKNLSWGLAALQSAVMIGGMLGGTVLGTFLGGPLGTVVGSAVGSMIGAGVGGLLGNAINRIGHKFCDEAQNKVFPLVEEAYTPRFVIDPSGYVYDIDTDERIPNAKATSYWIPTPETGADTEYWANVPTDEDEGEIWDAGEWSQSNPIYTNSLGQYAWDVPEGWWRVKVEAEDYETAWSDWMPVPPEQTDVNIGLEYNKNILLGDVNDDGTVDARDRRLLARILDGQVTDESEYFFRAADIDKDRELTLIDLTILARTLAGWAEYAGKWGVVLEN